MVSEEPSSTRRQVCFPKMSWRTFSTEVYFTNPTLTTCLHYGHKVKRRGAHSIRVLGGLLTTRHIFNAYDQVAVVQPVVRDYIAKKVIEEP